MRSVLHALAIAAFTWLPCAAQPRAQVELEPWTFTPAVTGGDVVGFLAWMPETLVIGDNISVVWAQRDADGWSYWAWSDDDLAAAAVWVRETWDDRAIFRGADGIGAALVERMRRGADGDPPAPDPLGNGVFGYDIFGRLVTGRDGDALWLGCMAAAGFRVAPILGPMMLGGGVCPDADEGSTLDDFMDSADAAVRESLGLRASGETACSWPCKCVKTETEWEVAPGAVWTITRTVIGERAKCEYTRPASYAWEKRGQKAHCPSCRSDGTCTGHEYGAVDVHATDPCPPDPGYGTEFIGDAGC